MKFIIACLFLLIPPHFPFPVSAEIREGADKSAPGIAEHLEKMGLSSGVMYIFSDAETARLIGLASELHINVFELIDCTYRYTAQRNLRVSILGDSIRKILPLYDLGQERVLALLPVDKMIKLETGASLISGQKAFDMFLDVEHQSFIEIGTALYQKQFGFGKISPLLFSEPYGIMVKKMFITAPLEKLELYEPGKGAIYVKNLGRPKRWNLWTITKKSNQ